MGFSGFNFAPLATEWSGGGVIKLGGLPGSTNSVAQGINNAGQAVGFSSGFNFFEQATEWSHGHVIDLGTGAAYGINDAGQAVGIGPDGATEWSHGSIIDLGGLPGSRFSEAFDINDAGQVVGLSDAMSDVGYASIATEWSHGHVIDLGGLPGSSFSEALGINNVGQVVGQITVPESFNMDDDATRLCRLGLRGSDQDLRRDRPALLAGDCLRFRRGDDGEACSA